MIRLSPMAGAEEVSVYFEIRDIALQPTGKGTEGMIRGLLGDGQREIWAEVRLGENPRADILPLWTEDGQVETLAVDEQQLKQQLLVAVQEVFSTVASWSTPRSIEDDVVHQTVKHRHHWLAA